MLSNRFFPYSSMQEINLDWILTKIKNILRFVPDDGAVGQILRRTAHGAEWSDEQGGGGAVSSVNGQTGAVVLDAGDVGALPDTTVIPSDTSDLTNTAGFVDAAGAAAAAPVQSVNSQTGTVVLSIPSDTSDLTNTAGFVDAAGAAAAAPVQSVNSQTGAVVLGKSDVGLGNVDNVQQYSASNPPPYPVTSVNGQTGSVVIPSASWDIEELTAGLVIYRQGNIRIIVANDVAVSNPIVTLPASDRPSTTMNGFGLVGTNGSDRTGRFIRVTSAGNVGFYTYSGSPLSTGYGFGNLIWNV